MSFLSLPDAHILHSRGWGTASANTRFRVEFADSGELVVYRAGIFGEKKALFISALLLTLRTWSDTVKSGGGFVGGGFGAEGAAEGILGAAILNALTSRRHEYAMLVATSTEFNGTVRELVFGWRNMAESTLRDCVSKALVGWTAIAINSVIAILRGQDLTPELATATYRDLDIVARRGLISKEQLDRVRAVLAPFTPPPGHAAQGFPQDRVSQLRALAELRESGALTQEEFEIEKARILAT